MHAILQLLSLALFETTAITELMSLSATEADNTESGEQFSLVENIFGY